MTPKENAQIATGARMALLIVVALIVGQSCRAETAKGTISIDQVAHRAMVLKGHRIIVRGYIVIEPEDKDLWARAETYGQTQEPCISLDITDALFNRRESYNRREAYISGIVSTSACGGEPCIGGCSDIGLTKIAVVRFTAPLSPEALLQQTSKEPSLLIDQKAPDEAELRNLGARLAALVRAGYSDRSKRRELLTLIPERYRPIVSKALSKKGARPNWLLFDWKGSLGHALANHPDTPMNVAQTELSGENRKNFICYCVVSGYCDPTGLTAQRVYFRAAADPYFCIPARNGKDGLALDAGFLVGRPDEEKMD